MLDFYKRCWHIFLTSAVLLGLGIIPAIYYLEGKSYQWDVIIALLILAIICLVIGLIGFIKAFKYARKEERETKAAKNHEALKGSFRRANPEWTDEQVEIAAADRPYAPPIEGEEEWMSPMEAYKKSCRKKK